MNAYDDLCEVYAARRSDDPGSNRPVRRPSVVRRAGARRRLRRRTPVASALSAGFDVVGVDGSRGQLRLASERAPAATLVRGDVTALGFRDASFDGLCAVHSVIPSRSRNTLFEEFVRVLRPGAPCLVSAGSEALTGWTADWLDSGVEMLWSYPDPDETVPMLEDAGFELLGSASVTDTHGEDARKLFFLARRAGEP